MIRSSSGQMRSRDQIAESCWEQSVAAITGVKTPANTTSKNTRDMSGSHQSGTVHESSQLRTDCYCRGRTAGGVGGAGGVAGATGFTGADAT